jgi:hypothetical protein
LGVVLVVGCGGGDEDGEAPPVDTPAAEVAAGDLTPADLIARLPELALTAEDLPSGFVLASSADVPNEMVAEGDPFPEQRLQELEETGRVGGYQVIFQSQQGLISAVLSVYETAVGAQQSLEMGVRFGLDVEAVPADAPDVGLPALAWQIEEQTARSLKGYLMLARKGRINISITYGDAAGASEDDTEALLSAQIARLGDIE